MTVKEAAAALAEHPDTTRARLRRGELRGVRKSNGPRARWHITEKALAAFIERNTR
ncbi:helix-turn-helix domain-containing protein [Micrococcus lylae]|uniref:helix-turn-helix domain-containing protein n=1 Tax=Micrococcus lylae TaxID=1273 RepID=UPI0014314DEA|nr:helix-turn-helix domain-containing protein [Micrococcus lylae]